jgi:PAS domain S-box-containing protein
MAPKLGRLATPLIAFALIVLAANAWISYRNIVSLVAKEKLVQRAQEVLVELEGVLADVTSAVASERGYLLTGDEELVLPFDEAKVRANERIKRLNDLIVDARQKERMVLLSDAIANEFVVLDKGMELRKAGPASPAEMTSVVRQGRKTLREMRSQVTVLKMEENRLLAERDAASKGGFTRALVTLATATAVAMGMVVLAYALMRRDESARQRAGADLRASEDRSRLLLQSTGEGVFGVDMNGDCTFANQACVKMLGYDDPAELLGKATHELMHHTRPDGTAYPKEQCRIQLAFRAGQGVEVDDEVFWRSDGTSFPVEYRSSPIVNNGEKLGAVVSFVDTTARRRTEQGMRLRESALRAISQGVFITDPARSDEPITYVNAAFEELTGYPWQEIKGRKIDFFAGPDTDPLSLAGLEEALKVGREHSAELLLYRKDEAPFWGTISLAPVADVGGRVTHFVGVVTDVTARRRWEEELKRSKDEAEAIKEEAEAANVAKSQFLANMSHELRTPLNAVIMYSELLQEEAEDRKLDGFIPDLDKIRAAGKHLLALVNGVLDLSKIEAGKMDLYLETFDVSQMVHDVAATVQPLVQKRSNKLELRCPTASGSMQADLTKVRQILFNLLSNAAKFTERGTVAVDVERREVDGVESIVVRVTDTGIGMTPAQLTKLFQPFTQADASTTRKYGGTGLGLAISKRFSEIMGGEITAESEPGKGSVFTLRLPSRVAKPVTAESGKADERVTTGAAAGGAPTVLVIDDEPSVHELMSRALAAEGIRVATALDGEAGLRVAREIHPCLIFLDVLMPKMDGWAVLTALKADPHLADIPVVMLTITSDKDMGFLLGASEFLTKPIDRDRLGSLIKRYRPAVGACEVLVVEDDEPTRQVIRRTLAKQGWTVAEAENGRAALDQVRRLPPSLILLDLMMPEMDGFEFLSELRKNEKWDSIPVVVLTAKDLTPPERAMLSGNVERILQKGAYTRDALLLEVRKIVSQCTGTSHSAIRPHGNDAGVTAGPSMAAESGPVAEAVVAAAPEEPQAGGRE